MGGLEKQFIAKILASAPIEKPFAPGFQNRHSGRGTGANPLKYSVSSHEEINFHCLFGPFIGLALGQNNGRLPYLPRHFYKGSDSNGRSLRYHFGQKRHLPGRQLVD
jgi:hypothetical protein